MLAQNSAVVSGPNQAVSSNAKAPSDNVKNMLNDPDVGIRSAGYKLLARGGNNPEALELLTLKGMRDKSPAVRQVAAVAVVQALGQEKASFLLGKISQDKTLTSPERNVATLGLSECGTNALPHIMSLLNAEEGVIRYRALQGVEVLKGKGIDISCLHKKIVDLVEKEQYPDAKKVAAKLFSQF